MQRQSKRTCGLCRSDARWIDYKNIEALDAFVDEGGRLRSRRRTHTCARHQRMVTQAVKRARHVALLPFTADHVRLFG